MSNDPGSVPPPTPPSPPPAAPVNPVEAIKLPALGLMAVGGIGILWQIGWMLWNLLGVAGSAVQGQGGMMGMLSGGFGVAINVVGIIVGGVLIFGGMKMQKLQSYNLSMGVAVAAMIPCISPCCLLGLPIGIWALITLLKPEVKAAFAG